MDDVKLYRYFVSYEGPSLRGRIDINRDKPITSIMDICALEAELTLKKGEQIIILFWRRFEEAP
jgi:hypothetical protein